MRNLLVITLILGCRYLTAQDTLPSGTILPVTISVTRLETPLQRLPFAVNVLDTSWIKRAQAQRSLGEALVAMPGVYAWNTDNYAQDLRISIRGFGARSAFGVRGIRVFTDGVPDTSPDGQTDLDNLDMGAVEKIEALRGTAAGMYGNAAGGVLWIQTDQPTTRFAEMQTTVGSFDFLRWQLKTATPLGHKSIVFFNISQNYLGGYRAHSATQQTIGNLKWRFQWTPKTTATLLLNYGYSPYAHDPGGLTAEQRLDQPTMARVANEQFNAGEKVAQNRIGYVLQHRFSTQHQFSSTVFFTLRNFDSRLPFQSGGWVDLQRQYGGGSAIYTYTAPQMRLQIGMDMGRQRDLRQRYDNAMGLRGNVTFDQVERFHGVGAFVQHELFLTKKISTTAIFRADLVQMKVKDQFAPDGNQSGAARFNRLSPTLGLQYALRKDWSLYANSGTHFETPTLNELSANPDQTGGFNPSLKPQQSRHIEAGSRYNWHGKWQLEMALFHIALRNEFVPYQLAATPGRTYFRNAGASQRTGIETAVRWRPRAHWTVWAHYNYSNFRYTNYEASGVRFDGKQLPAIPQHRGFAAVSWQNPKGAFATAQVQSQSRLFTDDANTVQDDGYTLFALRSGYVLERKKYVLSPFLGWNNVFNARYSNNILINAAAGRYFEPAADKGNIYIGIGVKIR